MHEWSESMDAIKVSAIIPNYNHAKYLRQRIDSVLHQSYTNLEVIILDDCSTDDSKEIINSYRDHPLVCNIEFNFQNTGSPFRQWEKGIMKATGEWIWIAESDDYADRNFVKRLLEAPNGLDNIGLIYCDSKIVTNEEVLNETFSTIKNEKLKTKRWSSDYFNNGIDEIMDYVLPYGTINNTSAVLFKKSILIEVNPFDTKFIYIGDKYAFIKVLAAADVKYVKESLNFYRNALVIKKINYHKLYREHFLVFDWVFKNLPALRNRLMPAFYQNTRYTFYRNWDRVKIDTYIELFKKNPILFIKSLLHNIFAPIFD